jgi:hypothetical protein
MAAAVSAGVIFAPRTVDAEEQSVDLTVRLYISHSCGESSMDTFGIVVTEY